MLRAFSSGCTALTGVEAISNGVPAFKKPKSKNAATTLLLLGVLAVTMFVGVTCLALVAHVHVADSGQLTGTPKHYEQRTVITQVAEAVFGGTSSIGFIAIAATTALILVLAANTAFNGFPVLGSILAQDRYLPRQLHTRGDRLAFSNGIIVLAGFATLLIVVFQAEVTRLIQLYIIGVFVSFVCSQSGMVRHWNRLLRTEEDPQVRRRMRRSQTINMTGAILTGTVLVIVLLTKFTRGAWIVCVAMPIIFFTMKSIRRHYDRVAARARAGAGPADPAEPGLRHRPGEQAAPADAAGAGVRQGEPAARARSDHGEHRRQRHRGAAGGVAQTRDQHRPRRDRLAVPRDHPARHQVRAPHPP